MVVRVINEDASRTTTPLKLTLARRIRGALKDTTSVLGRTTLEWYEVIHSHSIDPHLRMVIPPNEVREFMVHFRIPSGFRNVRLLAGEDDKGASGEEYGKLECDFEIRVEVGLMDDRQGTEATKA